MPLFCWRPLFSLGVKIRWTLGRALLRVHCATLDLWYFDQPSMKIDDFEEEELIWKQDQMKCYAEEGKVTYGKKSYKMSQKIREWKKPRKPTSWRLIATHHAEKIAKRESLFQRRARTGARSFFLSLERVLYPFLMSFVKWVYYHSFHKSKWIKDIIKINKTKYGPKLRVKAN